MAQLIRATLGGHVPLRVRCRERRSDAQNGRAYAPNGVRIASITDPTGVALAANTIPAFRHVTDSEFVAMWDTSALTKYGDYKVDFEVVAGYDTVAQTRQVIPKNVIVRLVKQGAP